MAASPPGHLERKTVFFQSADDYRAETEQISRIWWIFCPIAVPLALWLLALVNQPFYSQYLQAEETGVLEFLHAALPFAAAAIAARLLFMQQVRRNAWVGLWLVLVVIGGIYLGGEEASWGQHYFGWVTPSAWSEINMQGETNIHNTSVWFDKLPRVSVTIMIITGGLIVPFIKLYASRLIPHRLDFIIPPLALTVLAAVFVLGEILSGIRSQTDFLARETPFRPGEMQENLIVAFIFFYMVFLWSRAGRMKSSGHADARPGKAVHTSAPAVPGFD